MSLVFGQAPDPEDSSGQWLSVPRSADWILVVQKIIAIVQDLFPQLNRDRVFNALQTSQVLIQGRKKRKIKRRSFRPCHVMRHHLEPISHLKFCKMSSPLQSMQVFANTMISYHKRFSFQNYLPGRIQGNAFHLETHELKLIKHWGVNKIILKLSFSSYMFGYVWCHLMSWRFIEKTGFRSSITNTKRRRNVEGKTSLDGWDLIVKTATLKVGNQQNPSKSIKIHQNVFSKRKHFGGFSALLGVPFHVLRKKNQKNQSMHGGGAKLQSQIEM